MRFERSKDWWLSRIAKEPDGPIGAGRMSSETNNDTGAGTSEIPETASFGELVHLLRRREGLSVDKFAETVDIEVSEAQAIEEDPYYRAEARTVWRIARVYDLPQTELNELAGVVVANDVEPFLEPQRYAARSELCTKLSGDEVTLLNLVVTVIKERVDQV